MYVSLTVLLKVILVDNSDGLLECTRVYGNLSRYPGVRKIIVDNKGATLYCYQHTPNMCSCSQHVVCIYPSLIGIHLYPYQSHHAYPLCSHMLRMWCPFVLLLLLVSFTNNLCNHTCTYTYMHMLSLMYNCVTHAHTPVVDEIMVALLDSDRREMIYCACGVLVNIMADSQYRDTFSGNGGIRKWVNNQNMFMYVCVHLFPLCINLLIS